MEVKIITLIRANEMISKKTGKKFGFADAIVEFESDIYSARFWLAPLSPLPVWKGGEKVICKLNECRKADKNSNVEMPSLTLSIK